MYMLNSKAAYIYFWSVSLVDQLSGQFHIFLVDQKPISHFFGRPIFFYQPKTISPVHVVLVSLLVDQLSGLFLIFFGSTNFFFGWPKINLVDQKKNWSTKNMRKWFLVDQKKNWSTKKMRNWFLVDQKKNWSTKKMWNWPDNWSTKETDQKYMDTAHDHTQKKP